MRAEKSNRPKNEFIPDTVRKIAEAINPVIVDGFALYEKTKKFYLRLTKLHFCSYHHLFDEQAQEIFDSMDVLAEQLRQSGAPTIPSSSHTGELQSVGSYNSDFLSLGEMTEELVAGNRQIVVSLQLANKICQTMGETTINNTLQNILDQTERRIRFLSAAKLRI